MSQATVVSSPGKVLLAGGYLVLDPKYSGVVVATSSRFYTVIAAGASDTSRAQNPVEIRVRSPQFVDATWIYLVHVDQTAVRVEQVADQYVLRFANASNDAGRSLIAEILRLLRTSLFNLRWSKPCC